MSSSSLERAASRLAARRVRVLAAIHTAEQTARLVEAASGGGPLPTESAADRDRHWVSEEVALILRVAAVTAQEQLLQAHHLVCRLPETVALLEAGELHPWQAQKLSDAVLTLTDTQCADVQTRVLAKAAGQSMSAFGRSLTRAVMVAAPKTAEQAHTDALAEQRVEVRPLEHGMALLLAWLPAPDALRIKAAITTRANVTNAGGSDCRAIDHRRATAFIELIDLGAANPATTDPANPVTTGKRTAPGRPGDRLAWPRCSAVRSPRRVGRVRTDPTRPGPRPRGRPERHLATNRHRPPRQSHRLRPTGLPATRPPRPVHPGPRPRPAHSRTATAKP